MQGFQGFPGSPQNVPMFGSIPYFGSHPSMHGGPPDVQPAYHNYMQRPPQGLHQGYDSSFVPGYGMPPAPLGFQQGMFPPPRGGFHQPQHRGAMPQQRGFQGPHPGPAPSYRGNQQNPSKRPGGVPQQNGVPVPQPPEKRGGRLSIVNPETNREIEIPPQAGKGHVHCIEECRTMLWM